MNIPLFVASFLQASHNSFFEQVKNIFNVICSVVRYIKCKVMSYW